jgi:hypothetical protein
LPDLVGFLIEGTFGGSDQQTQHERGQCTDQTRCHFYDLESGCRCRSDKKGRTTTPTSAPLKITVNTRSETIRSFIIAISPPLRLAKLASFLDRAAWLKTCASPSFVNQRRLRCRRSRCRLRDRQRHPAIPALRPVFRREFPVSFEIQVSLQGADRKNESNLGTNAEDARFEFPEYRRLAAVGGELLIDVADQPNMDLLGDEL